MVIAREQCLLQLFTDLMSEGQWQELEGSCQRSQIYTLPVVIAMMLLQRLNERGTQQEAVHQIVAGRLDDLLGDCERARAGRISSNTGGYARACKRIGVGVVERACDQLLAELSKRVEAEPELEVPLLLLDGSSLRLEHVEGLLEDFPPGRNQHNEGHWGIVRWVGVPRPANRDSVTASL